MSKTAVVYWSGTGNTEAMAAKVGEGAQAAGAEVSLFTAAEFGTDKMDEFEPMFLSCEVKLGGKKTALFGSYGWGDGEWMRTWEETCREDGAVLACDCVICNDAPDAEAESACEELGKALA